MKSSIKLMLLALIGGASFLASAATQPAFPTAPIHFIVPYSAGGTVDIVGRLVAQGMAAKLGQPAVVENKAGAGSLIGADYVAKSRPDGYTVLVAPNTTLTVAPNLYKSNVFRASQIDPLGLVSTNQFVLTVNGKSPLNNLQDLIAAAKKEPNKLSYGTSGSGTIFHLMGASFNQAADTKILHVPYKGSSNAMADLLGNSISMMFDAIPASIPHIRSGNLKAIVVTGPARSPLLPNVPTIAESGLPNYKVEGWIALGAPNGLPAPIREALRKALESLRNDAEFQKQLRDLGVEPASNAASAQLGERIKAESSQFQLIINQAKITLD